MSTGPAIRFQTCWLPKRGHADNEYEDAHDGDLLRGRFAIADGASETMFAGHWAQLLVEAFVQTSPTQPAPWSSWLPAIQGQWLAALNGRELPWFAEANVQQGAFATFLGLVVYTPCGFCTKQRWQAIAVGDSCLFQVRADKLCRAFPIERARDFDNAPWLLGSRSSAEAAIEKEVRDDGEWTTGDRFWLMTDALAHWFLEEFEAGRKPWQALEQLLTDPHPQEGFAAWIEGLRDSRALRNDDVTLEAIGV